MSEVPARTVLVIDDDADLRRILRKNLEAEGFVVLEAEDGRAGVDAAMASPPDLVLLDIRMPNLSGDAALTELRAAPATQDVPVIMLTGETDDGALLECLRRGANDYVRKPYPTEKLLARVSAHIAAREAQRMRAALELAGAACHEMNQPLQVLMGHAEILPMLLDSASPSAIESARRSTARIAEATERLASIVHRLQVIRSFRSVPYVRGERIADLRAPVPPDDPEEYPG
jgi:DNA-binding response OmpR family regulator